MNLEELRAKINEIDVELVKLIARRLSYMPDVGKYKKENGLPLTQPEREKEILEAKRKLAQELGVDPDLIEKIFVLLFEEAKKIQEKA